MEKVLSIQAKVLEELNQQLAAKYESRSLLNQQIDNLVYRLQQIEDDLLQLSSSILELEKRFDSFVGQHNS